MESSRWTTTASPTVGKGGEDLQITEKTGELISILNVTDENDLMIINKSGIAIRLAVDELRVMGRATQGVRLISLRQRLHRGSVQGSQVGGRAN